MHCCCLGFTFGLLPVCAEQSFDVVSTWRLPNVKCKRCVLQWRYITAHMCL